MIQVGPARVRLLVAAMLGAMIVAAWGTVASAQTISKLSFQDLVAKSDSVLVAKCTERKTAFKNGNIVTHYKLKPSETWKGRVPLSKEGNLELEELGGALDEPIPLAQSVPGMVDLANGEETLLFCAMPKASTQRAGAKSLVDPKLPYVLGRWQGHYTVFPHPVTGEKLVGQASLTENPASPVNPQARQTMLKLSQQAASSKAGAANTKTRVKMVTKASKHGRPAADELQSMNKLGEQINKAADEAKTRRAAKAAKDPKAADDIYMYEPLSAIKMRVMREAQKTRN